MCIKIHYLYLPIFIDTDCTTNVSPSTNTVHIPHTLFFLSLGVLVVMGYAVNMQNLVRDSCRWLITINSIFCKRSIFILRMSGGTILTSTPETDIHLYRSEA